MASRRAERLGCGCGLCTPAVRAARAKRRPGELSYGSPGNGSAGHLAAAYLAHLAGIQVVQVAYRGGGPAIQDVLSATG